MEGVTTCTKARLDRAWSVPAHGTGWHSMDLRSLQPKPFRILRFSDHIWHHSRQWKSIWEPSVPRISAIPANSELCQGLQGWQQEREREWAELGCAPAPANLGAQPVIDAAQ